MTEFKRGVRGPRMSFVIPLASRSVVNNWDLVSRLCSLTVRSCLAQTNPDLSVELCCHDFPKILQDIRDPRFSVHVADFPPPNQPHSSEDRMTDKWLKVAMGLVAVRRIGSDFVMVVDADDYVSRDLNSFLNAAGDLNGVIIKQGYRYRFGSEIIVRDEKFSCGTNAILKTSIIELPRDISQEEQNKCVLMQSGHRKIEKNMKNLNFPLTRLPYQGAVYVQHSDQDSRIENDQLISPSIRMRLGAFRRARPARAILPRKFGVSMCEIRKVVESYRME